MIFQRTVSVLLAAILSYSNPSLALDPVDPNAPAAYFATTTSTNATYVVAMNFVQNGDIYIHMHSSTSCSWFGVGIGHQMDGAAMMVAYKDANGTGVVTSVRKASEGRSEPIWMGDKDPEGPRYEPIFTDQYAPAANTAQKGGIQISHGLCRNCSSFGSMKLDYTSKQQPFIFAIGPNSKLESNALDAPLRRHEFYGHFTMDMTVSTSNSSTRYGRVPAPNLPEATGAVADSLFATQGASEVIDGREDSEWALPAHAALMCLAFLLVFPLGALLLRILHSVLWHGVAQIVGVLFVLVGLGLGVHLSHHYNRSRDFNSGHQTLGLVIFATVFIQLGLGLVHHLIYRRTKQPTVISKIHLFLGPLLILLALIDGGLGFNLAENHGDNIPYGIVVAVVAVIFIAIRLWLVFKHRPSSYGPDRESLEAYKTFGPGYQDIQTPVSAGSAAQHLGFEMGAQNTAGRQPAPPKGDMNRPAPVVKN
ncbi:hypothetical protein KC318_g171 [Hortaea werneckii]|nr:hypothetical protein KC334_g182 [Hortaea werneckii]KAI7027879.1 hypothetical protein KC355_g172 [Hortaea werneckii]KAI7676584.1 hypothetical protein KC318_g171 [Hortaea werneckii]